MEKKYSIIRKIGQGEHGIVYLVEENQVRHSSKNKLDSQTEQKLYAMKKIPISNNYFDFQAKLLLSLDHPNVIRVKQVFQEKSFLILILQLAQQGDMHQFIKRNYFKKVPQNLIVSWLCQLSLGLYYLHIENNIIHRDIKSRNILVKQNGILKLADFGVARKLQNGQDFAKTSVGTPCYLSPEAINLGKYDKKSDVWSLGCLMYQLCTGEKPFQGQSLGSLLHNIVNNQFGQIPTKYSLWLRQLISSMLQKNPAKRPTILFILENPYIKKTFNQLKQVYPQYRRMVYPGECRKTTKYLDIEDRKLSCLKIFSQSLKTTKNQKSSKLQIQQKDSNCSSSQNNILKQKGKTVMKNQYIVPKNMCGLNRNISSLRKPVNSVIQIKGSGLNYSEKEGKKAQVGKVNQISCSLNKALFDPVFNANLPSRKVQNEKFLGRSLKSIIANRTKEKVQKHSQFKKD